MPEIVNELLILSKNKKVYKCNGFENPVLLPLHCNMWQHVITYDNCHTSFHANVGLKSMAKPNTVTG